MPVYILHPNPTPTLEMVGRTAELESVQGKFLYFSPFDALVIADSLDLFHKDIFVHVRSLSFRGLFPSVEKPDGYGRIEYGEIVSWQSVFFGETPLEYRQAIESLCAHID